MSAEELELIGQCMRNVMVSGTNIFILGWFLLHIFQRSKNWWLVPAFWVTYYLLRNILTAQVLPFYFADAAWLPTVQLLVPLIGNTLSWFVWYFSVETEFIRLGIVAFCGEWIISFISFAGLAVVNLLEQRPLWEMGEWRWPDILFPITGVIGTLLVWRFVGKWILKLRTCKLRATWLLWTVFLGYNAFAINSHFRQSVYNWEGTAAMYTVLYLAIFVFLIWVVITKKNHMRHEQAFLDAQKRVLETHYDVVKSQIQHVEEQQKLIDEQMATIVGMDAVVDSETMQAYLSQLRENYEGIRAGIYCNDWAIDAMLYLQKKAYEEQGIGFECLLQQYDRGEIREQDLLQILFALLEYGRNGKRISLHMAAVKNQLVIRFEVVDAAVTMLPKKELKTIVQKYHGELNVQEKDETMQVVMMLETIR